MTGSYSIGDYLIHSLAGRGITHIFGVPGDYILSFYDRLTKSKISVVNTCDEQGAGFAADAYPRIRGLGVVCITYCVGALKIINTTAQAYAEKSPVVVISGAPGLKEQIKNPLLHHKVRDYDTQKKIFDQITVASTVMSDPQTAAYEIHRVISAALRFKCPKYIELPRDVVTTTIAGQYRHPIDVPEPTQRDPNSLREAVIEAINMINAATRPVIIAGEEIHTFALQDSPEVIGGGQGFHVETEDKFNYVISDAFSHSSIYRVIDVRLERNDKSPALDRLTTNVAKQFYNHLDSPKLV